MVIKIFIYYLLKLIDYIINWFWRVITFFYVSHAIKNLIVSSFVYSGNNFTDYKYLLINNQKYILLIV